MRAVLMHLVFGICALAALAASAGVAAPPHRVPPGTPLLHTLAIGAYRYAFLVDPIAIDASLPPEMAAIHSVLALAGIPMPEMPGMTPSASQADLPTLQPTGGVHACHDLAITLAVLALLVPRLPRPTRMLLARLDRLAARPPQWWPVLSPSPPRLLPASLSSA